jgi:transposase
VALVVEPRSLGLHHAKKRAQVRPRSSSNVGQDLAEVARAGLIDHRNGGHSGALLVQPQGFGRPSNHDRLRAAAYQGQRDLERPFPVLGVPTLGRKPTGRQKIPDSIPRVDIRVVPPEVERLGLDAFEIIGEEVTEILERRPASLIVARVVKPKFLLKRRNVGDPIEVHTAGTPALPIDRGLAGPGMLADTIVRRWEDHTPLNRLEKIYARDGIEIARSTVCGWHMQLVELVKPVVDAMRHDAFEQPYLCVDATGVLVQAKEQCRVGHFWVMVAPDRHVLFEFTPKHNAAAVDSVLAGYEGYLVADAHAVYDHLYVDGKVTEVNCWAHARRYFFKAMFSDPTRARAALGLINALFRIERGLADSPKKKREAIRRSKSKPLVDHFFSWCEAERDKVLDDTPIQAGIRYALNQRAGLCRFLDDGRLPLHNNLSELNLRHEAVGRKNWLFVGSPDGGEANALFVSLLASCRLHKVEPWSYLRDVLCLLSTGWPTHRMLELAPVSWSKTVADDAVQRLLAANPYRALTLLRQ